MDQQTTIPKKRGRKPLNKNLVAKNNEPPKRRGRKPKDKVGSLDLTTKVLTKENIILHLPITIDSEDDIPTKHEPIAFDITNNFMPIPLNEVDVVKTENIEATASAKDTYDTLVKQRENEIKTKDNNTKELLLDYIEYRKMNKWPTKTSIPCMNDSHSFHTKPCGIPIKLDDKKCIMYGNFCSPSCAAAYNFETNLDSNAFERYSFLNYIYNDNKPIFIANSKLLINTWGGQYTIDEYRNMNGTFKHINVEIFPFVATIPTLEETSHDLDITKPINFDKDKLKKVSTEYKLQRNNPLPDHKNTLESCMNLKFV